MTGKQFLIVDVFAEEPFAGNRLTVFLGAGDLSTDRMQALALEMGCAESSFILSNEERIPDTCGVPEDSATGSANGCLAGYRVQHRYFGEPSIDIRVEQRYEIRRPSLLTLRACETPEEIEIHVGGKVFMIARGELLT